ncbi:MAG: hypothetical protein ACREXY_12340 [Gammaproteobacteria bacterium]
MATLRGLTNTRRDNLSFYAPDETPDNWTAFPVALGTLAYTPRGRIFVFSREGWESMATPFYVIKTADEIVNNSTTLQNDNELFTQTLPKNSVWDIEMLLHHRSGTTPDFKHALTLPTGATLVAAALFFNTTGTLIYAATAGASFSTGGLGAVTIDLSVRGILRLTNPGVVQLQWAQNTADASDTTVFADSFLKLTRIE